MPKAIIPDDDFIRLWRIGGEKEVCAVTGQGSRNARKRRRNLERKYNIIISSPNAPIQGTNVRHPQRLHAEIDNGIVLIASDGHYWPGPPSTAHQAFVHFIKELKPDIVIKNGDAFDGASVSRHARTNWDEVPEVQAEIEACEERLTEIEDAAKGAQLYWPFGNHDARFEAKIANALPQYKNVTGVSLKDHFPMWNPCYSVFINDDVVVKHRFKGGIHATHNNTLWAGMTMFTGHLHSAKVTPVTDYNGTRYGVDCGCLADPCGPQFEYTEDNPKNWRSGFAVATFHKGKLLQPELVLVWEPGVVQFRGELIDIGGVADAKKAA